MGTDRYRLPADAFSQCGVTSAGSPALSIVCPDCTSTRQPSLVHVRLKRQPELSYICCCLLPPLIPVIATLCPDSEQHYPSRLYLAFSSAKTTPPKPCSLQSHCYCHQVQSPHFCPFLIRYTLSHKVLPTIAFFIGVFAASTDLAY
ncbi:hypothetical protein IAS59_001934 [Cryptococcus gattii]